MLNCQDSFRVQSGKITVWAELSQPEIDFRNPRHLMSIQILSTSLRRRTYKRTVFRTDLPTLVGSTVVKGSSLLLQLRPKGPLTSAVFCPVLQPRGPPGPTSLLGGYYQVCQKDLLCQESQLKISKISSKKSVSPLKMKITQLLILVDSTGKKYQKSLPSMVSGGIL